MFVLGLKKGKMNLKYPKLTLLVLSFILAYALFSLGFLDPILNTLILLGYFGVFMVGFLYAYSFTAGPATIMLILLAKKENFFFAGLTAGVGALIGDIITLYFVRSSFSDEIDRLAAEKLFLSVRKSFPSFLQKYLSPILASIIIASPIPAEIGVAILASMKSMSTKRFIFIAYVLHTIGIFILLFIGMVG